MVVPIVKDLDLSKNLFSSLEDLSRVTKGLKYLEILRISHNRFEEIPAERVSGFETVRNILVIIGQSLDNGAHAAGVVRSFTT